MFPGAATPPAGQVLVGVGEAVEIFVGLALALVLERGPHHVHHIQRQLHGCRRPECAVSFEQRLILYMHLFFQHPRSLDISSGI